MITQLLLENWRSHEKSEFSFGKGTNVLVGNMGSGKSTTMDAICFGLFGSFPTLQQRKLKLDDVIMNKPEVKNDASVRVDFQVNGKEYSVYREVKRGKGTANCELRENGYLIEGPNANRVTERVCQVLKIDYDLFTRAVYSEQNNIDYFLEIPKGQRKQKIDELLQISRFENARKNLGAVVNRLSDRKEEKERIASSKKDLDSIPLLEKEITDKNRAVAGQEAALKQLEAKKEQAGKKYSELSMKRERFRELDRKVKEAQGKAGFLAQKLEGVMPPKGDEGEMLKRKRDLERLKEEVRTAYDKTRELEKQEEKFLGSIDQNEWAIKQYDRRLKEIEVKDVEALRSELEKTIKDHEDSNSDLALGRSRLNEINEAISRLKGGHDRCPTCESELNEHQVKRILLARENEKKEIDKAMRIVQEKQKDLLEKKKELESVINEESKNHEERKWVTENKQNAEKELKDIKGKLGAVRTELSRYKTDKKVDEIDEEIRKCEKALEVLEAMEQLKKTKEEAKKASEEINAMGYDERIEEQVLEALRLLEKEHALKTQELKNLSELIAEKQKRLDELLMIRREIDESRRESEFLEKTMQSFNILHQTLQEAQTSLRQEFTNTTNAALSDVWNKIYPYNDYTELRLGVDESGDYILQLQRLDGNWVNVEGVTSGGERTTACLALRIALALVLTQNLSWIVLDEPTHNLDKNAVKELASTLRNHLPQIVDQIFIITHEEELEAAASSYLYRLDRRKEEDEPTRVSVESAS